MDQTNSATQGSHDASASASSSSSSSSSVTLSRSSPADEGKGRWQDPHHMSTPPPEGQQHGAPRQRAKKRSPINGRVRVLVRCRPLIPNEHGHSTTRIHTTGNTVTVNDAVVGGEARQFTFDTVLSPEADQATTFEEVEPLLEHVLDGFHATVFAYGQTGSGKTHTMEGLSYVRKNAGRRKRKGAAGGGGGGGGEEDDGTGEAAVADLGTAVEEHGIMPRAIQLLFDRARLRQGDERLSTLSGEPDDASVQYTFRCSYYQIYNEVITDLLRASPSLPSVKSMSTPAAAAARGAVGSRKGVHEGSGLSVRFQKDNTFRVQNLFICECDSPDQMRQALFAGVQQKVMSSHLMNDQSSRSHCVFTVYVECRRLKTGDLVSRSELSMVDLAGSEKLGLLASNPNAKLVRESIDINTSLLALGKVITALAANSHRNARLAAKRGVGGKQQRLYRTTGGVATAAAAGHVPYRDSKLTMLLKHALGGNSLTLMVACISPSDRYVEETVSTLLYAGRASNIENVPRVNEDPTAALIQQLRNEILQLKEELKHYRMLAANGLLPVTNARPSLGNGSDAAGTTTTATATATLASEALHAVGLSAAGRDGTREAQLQQQSDNLADSLLAACDMLQQVIRTNGQLRDAYDVVKDAKEAADLREVQLNAENLALRERIQTLESIVLPNGGPRGANDRDDGDTDSEEETKAEVPHQRRKGHRSRNNEDRECSLPHERSEEDGGANSSGAMSSLRAPPPPPPPRRKIDWSKKPPASSTKPAASMSSGGVAEEKLEDLVEPEPRASPAIPHKRKAEKKSERKSRRRRRKVAKRLEAYEDKYHNPQGGTGEGGSTYASYYHRAAKTSHKSREGKEGVLSANAIRRQLLASRGDMQHTVTQGVVETQAMMKKLPEALAAEFVPQSLKHSRAYGTLAFCGGEEAKVPEFEAKRQDREARRQALLQRQQQLLQVIHTDIAERRFYQPEREAATCEQADTPDCGEEDGTFHPPSSVPPPQQQHTSVSVLSLNARQTSTRGPYDRLYTAAEQARPRWETGASLESLPLLRKQREQQELRRCGSDSSPYGAPPSLFAASSSSSKPAQKQPQGQQQHRPGKKKDKLSSMDKLLRYLREQSE